MPQFPPNFPSGKIGAGIGNGLGWERVSIDVATRRRFQVSGLKFEVSDLFGPDLESKQKGRMANGKWQRAGGGERDQGSRARARRERPELTHFPVFTAKGLLREVFGSRLGRIRR